MNRSSNSGDHVIWHLYSWQFPDKSPKRHHTRAPAPWSGKMNWKEEWVDEKILPWSHKAVNCSESGTCKSDCSMLFSFYFELDTDYSYLGRGMVDLSSCPDKMVNCGHVWGTVMLDVAGTTALWEVISPAGGGSCRDGSESRASSILHDFCFRFLLWVSDLTYKPNRTPSSSKFLSVLVFAIVTERSKWINTQ